MKRRLKFILPAILVTVIGTLVARYVFLANGNEDNDRLTLYGNIEMRTAQLAFIESERIARLLVEEGDAVSQGQALARLETGRLEARTAETRARVEALAAVVQRLETGTRPQQIEQARAEVRATRTRVANARLAYRRLRETAGTGVTSEQDVDDARTRLAVEKAQLEIKENALNLALEGPRKEEIAEARSRLQAARAALDLLTIRMADMTLYAPSEGVIQSRILETGEVTGPGRPVFTLALTQPKWVRAYVPEPQLGHIAPGMPAAVVSDSYADRTFDGWIGFISPTAEFTPKSVQTTDLRTQLVYQVRVQVRDPQNRLRLGMPVTVTVNTGAAPADRPSEGRRQGTGADGG